MIMLFLRSFFSLIHEPYHLFEDFIDQGLSSFNELGTGRKSAGIKHVPIDSFRPILRAGIITMHNPVKNIFPVKNIV